MKKDAIVEATYLSEATYLPEVGEIVDAIVSTDGFLSSWPVKVTRVTLATRMNGAEVAVHVWGESVPVTRPSGQKGVFAVGEVLLPTGSWVRRKKKGGT